MKRSPAARSHTRRPQKKRGPAETKIAIIRLFPIGSLEIFKEKMLFCGERVIQSLDLMLETGLSDAKGRLREARQVTDGLVVHA